MCLSDMHRCIKEFHDNSRQEHAAVKLRANSATMSFLRFCGSACAFHAVQLSMCELQVLHAAHGTGAIHLLQCHR